MTEWAELVELFLSEWAGLAGATSLSGRSLSNFVSEWAGLAGATSLSGRSYLSPVWRHVSIICRLYRNQPFGDKDFASGKT